MSFTHKMNQTEKVAVVSLSSIMGLRMMGLFMVLPVFSLYTHQLRGATPLLIGVAIGIYGLTQALFQIPFGMLSDYFGRSRIILIGLLIFILGSVIAGFANSIFMMILGRALQGAGAVGSTILAFLADFTRDTQRTKAMAIAGITIGASFSLAMFIGPLLTQWFSINHLFFLAALLGALSIIILYCLVPTPNRMNFHPVTEPEFKSFIKLIFEPQLAKLNMGIFILHAVFTASFIVIPITFAEQGFQANQQWEIYLPALLSAAILSLLGIGIAERKQQIKIYFLLGIASIALSEILLWISHSHLFFGFAICLFFIGFSLLEAFLPSLISRTAPASRKGSALGIYSCSQFLGIFAGGVVGGWLYGQYHFSGVYLFCIILSIFWFILAYLMQNPDFIRLKEQLQSE